MKKCLCYWGHSNNIKIAIPLMGCGVGGLDNIEVIKLYKEFFSKEIFLDCEVVIYGFTTNDYEDIMNVFDRKEEMLEIKEEKSILKSIILYVKSFF